MATSWFVYSGGAPNDPQNYSIISSIACCYHSPKQRLCAIFAEIQFIDEEEKPIVTSALQAEINLAVLNLQESANVRLTHN